MDNSTIKQYFESYPKAGAFYVTSDGNFFSEEKKSMADSHERSLGKKGKSKAQLLTRKEFEADLKTEQAETSKKPAKKKQEEQSTK